MSEDEEKHSKNILHWMKKSKLDSLQTLENLFAETVQQTIIFFDKNYEDHAFELSLKVRKRKSDE